MKAIDAINEQHSLLESNDSLNEESLDTSGENLKRAVLNEFASIKSKVDEMFGERTELSGVMDEAKSCFPRAVGAQSATNNPARPGSLSGEGTGDEYITDFPAAEPKGPATDPATEPATAPATDPGPASATTAGTTEAGATAASGFTGDTIPLPTSIHSIDFKATAEDIGMSVAEFEEAKATLGSCWCEQKWTDIICSQLVKQVSAISAEHGRTIHAVRTRYASVYDRSAKMHSDFMWRLEHCLTSLGKYKEFMRDYRDQRDEREAQMVAKLKVLEGHIREFEQGQETMEESMRAQYQIKMDRIGETLETMKHLYNDLTKDKEVMSIGSLKDANAKLKEELAEAKRELEELRPLKGQARSDKVNKLLLQNRLDAKLAECTELTQDLTHHKTMVEQLMERENGEMHTDTDHHCRSLPPKQLNLLWMHTPLRTPDRHCSKVGRSGGVVSAAPNE